jgi:hypothetical protein
LRRLFAVVGAIFIVVASAPGARAQETTTSTSSVPPQPVGLSLVSQSTWVGLHDTFRMRLHIEQPALAANPNAEILVRIHQSATSRSGFDDAIANEDLGGTLYVPPQIPLSTLRRSASNNVDVAYGLPGSDTSPRIRISNPGVYPVEVQLVNTGTATRPFVTWLVVVDTDADRAIEKPLSVGFVLAAVANPMVLPDGTDDPRVVKEMSAGGRLDKVAEVLNSTSHFKYSLVLGPETAQAWKRLSAHNARAALGFRRVRASALRSESEVEVLPTTYVPIDQSSVIASGLGQYLGDQYVAASAALRSALGKNPSPTPAKSAFIDAAPTSDAVVNQLRQLLNVGIGVREQALIPVTHPFSPAQAFVLETTGGESPAIATAPFIEDLFKGNDSSALRAQRVVAALAEVAYETPSIARGILVAPPEDWFPDVTMMQTVIRALSSLPLVQPVTLDGLFASISTELSDGSEMQRRLAPATPAPTPADPTEYQTTANELAAYADVVGAADPVVMRARAALLVSLSTNISPERAHEALANINDEIHSFTSSVTADEKRITLTSRRADVPLTFENNLRPARPVKVRVHLDSSKLTFPNGADQAVTLKPGSNTIRFSVEARASGTFPMTITVTSPDGRLAFGEPVQVSVRSAVFGGWAVGLTIAALVFLGGWWANHFRRTRRLRRQARATTAPTPAPSPTA